jgi:hypothetical protein
VVRSGRARLKWIWLGLPYFPFEPLQWGYEIGEHK